MSKFKVICKYYATLAIRQLLKTFFVFGIENKVVFSTYYNRFGGNLKYLYLYLDECCSKNDLKLIWVKQGNEDLSSYKNIKSVNRKSLAYIFHMLTAKVAFFDCGGYAFLPKRKHQLWIETWHGGGAYKKIFCTGDELTPYWIKRRLLFKSSIDFVVSSCDAFCKAYSMDNYIDFHYLRTGMPRNDIFFDKARVAALYHGVRERYDLPADRRIVLYAPTFRDNNRLLDFNLDAERLLEALNKKYHCAFTLFLKAHPFYLRKNLDSADKRVITVTDYPDMQELLCAADVMITDYSSCMWDFSLTEKPCFIYANDVAQYKDERNFHTPMSEWPFPVATNNDEMEANIAGFDYEAYVERVHQHHQALGSYEDGHATERVCKFINSFMRYNQ